MTHRPAEAQSIRLAVGYEVKDPPLGIGRPP